jgi:hypothetical protein
VPTLTGPPSKKTPTIRRWEVGACGLYEKGAPHQLVLLKETN